MIDKCKTCGELLEAHEKEWAYCDWCQEEFELMDLEDQLEELLK